MNNTSYNAMQGYLVGKMGLLKLLEQKAEATEDRFDIGRYFELENVLFELKNLISELKRFGEQEGQETQEQATEQPTEQLEGDEHLTLLEFCKKHEMGLYKNKETFTDFADDTFKAGSIIVTDKDGYGLCLNNGTYVATPYFEEGLEKGNIIELHNPYA